MGLFLEGFLTNLLNPKASMFYLAVFPQFINLDGNPILESLILVVIHSIVVLIWFSFIIIALGKITSALSSMKFKRIVQGATGSLMLWFGFGLVIGFDIPLSLQGAWGNTYALILWAFMVPPIMGASLLGFVYFLFSTFIIDQFVPSKS